MEEAINICPQLSPACPLEGQDGDTSSYKDKAHICGEFYTRQSVQSSGENSKLHLKFFWK